MLTLYTTPVVYLYLDRFRLWCKRKWSESAASPSATPGAVSAGGR
jgi:multidrug efflux pump